ncbi:MAG: RSP_7527 family protein [Paracoccaceae bacterium]
MKTENFQFPDADTIRAYEARAHRMRAEFLRQGALAAGRKLARGWHAMAAAFHRHAHI